MDFLCMADEHSNEVFIDADSGFGNEKDSYEAIILKQINKCADVLSREMTGGQVMHKETKTGTEKYMEDVRELVINHVDTLRMLMTTYIKEDDREKMKKVFDMIDEHKKKLGENKVIIPGKGIVNVSDFSGLSVDSSHWKDYINYKALRYRDIFEILICTYNQSKAYIRSLEEE